MLERLRAQVENSHTTNLRDDLTAVLETAQSLQTQMHEFFDWRQDHEAATATKLARIDKLEQRINNTKE